MVRHNIFMVSLVSLVILAWAEIAQAQSAPVIDEYAITVTVEAGDTLWDLALRHNVSLDALLELNGRTLRQKTIYVGEVIVVGRLPTQTPTVTPLPTETLVPTSTPLPTATQTPAPQLAPTATLLAPPRAFGELCLESFYDKDRDGRHDWREGFMDDASIEVAGESGVQAINLGNRGHSCHSFVSGNYTVTKLVQLNEQSTTFTQTVVTVSGGEQTMITFGSSLKAPERSPALINGLSIVFVALLIASVWTAVSDRRRLRRLPW